MKETLLTILTLLLIVGCSKPIDDEPIIDGSNTDRYLNVLYSSNFNIQQSK